MENYYKNDKYERAGEYVENLTVDSIIEFCHRWFGLANISEFFNDWNEYNNKNKECFSVNNEYLPFYKEKKDSIPTGRIIQVPIHEVKKAESPITFYNKREGIKPIIILNSLSGKEVKYNGFIAGAH